MKMNQNQIYFYEAYSSMISFFIDGKILKYLNDFYNWNHSISQQD